MKKILDPGKSKKTIVMRDGIVFTRQPDYEGNMLDLSISLIMPMGNMEMRLASGKDDELAGDRHKLILWCNGAGWHHTPMNIMVPELVYLAEAGYAVAIAQYRGSEKAHHPAQIEDVKTAIRFLRANADKLMLDTSKMAVMGRSAGGQMAAWIGMNTGDFITDEYADQSCHVDACIDMFGPADLVEWNDLTIKNIATPGYRWSRMEQSHEGMYMGGDMDTLRDRLPAASPINFISEKTCPMLILHGDQDPLVQTSISEHFYEKLCEAGLEDQSELCIIRNGGHGTREFFQEETKKEILGFLKRYIG